MKLSRQSALDKRDYRVITTANGLEILLISDEDTEKAAAALSVRAGSYLDPENLPGLAHFVEHLLFMGTSSYPDESEYLQYIYDHGGIANAFTTGEFTNFYFETNCEALSEALIRFLSFFKEPLFSEDCVEKEVKAIDSEFKKNLQDESWRIGQVSKTLSNRSHPWHKFSTGNYKTLSESPRQENIDVRGAVIDLYNRVYKANLMKLAVIGNQTLDELEHMVTLNATPIPRGDITPMTWIKPPLSSSCLGDLLRVESSKGSNHLELIFPVPDQQPLYECPPYQYYSYLVNHESKGSILALLREKKLSMALSAGIIHISEGYDQFLIGIELTQKGFKQWKDVISIVFTYVEMIRSSEPKEWIANEVQEMTRIRFQTKENPSPLNQVRNLVQIMHRPIPPQRYLDYTVITKYDPQSIKEFGKCLHIENARVILVGAHKQNHTERERWFGAKYTVEPLKLSQKKSRSSKLQFPEPNPFLSSPGIETTASPTKNMTMPRLIYSELNYSIWHKMASNNRIMKDVVYMKLTAEGISDTALSSVCVEVICALVSQKLSAFAYYAHIAGIKYALGVAHSGLEIEVSGTPFKLSKLLERILSTLLYLTKMDFDKYFSIIKESLMSKLRSALLQPPHEQILSRSNWLLADSVFSIEERLVAIKGLKKGQVMRLYSTLKSNGFRVEALVLGGSDEIAAMRLFDAIRQIVGPFIAKLLVKEVANSLFLPKPSQFYWKVSLNDEKETNSAIDYCLQVGSCSDPAIHAGVLILLQLLTKPLYHQLRTIEQLGYVVGCMSREIRDVLYLRIFIQSEQSTIVLQDRIENFLRTGASNLVQDAASDTFILCKETVIKRLLETPRSLEDEATMLWGIMKCRGARQYDFEFSSEVATACRAMTREQLNEMYDRFVNPESSNRASFVTHLIARNRPKVPSLETALGRSVGRLVVERQIKVTLGQIAAFALKCRSLTPDEAMKALRSRLIEAGVSEEEASAFVKDAMNSAIEQSRGHKDASYPGEQVIDAKKFKAGLDPYQNRLSREKSGRGSMSKSIKVKTETDNTVLSVPSKCSACSMM